MADKKMTPYGDKGLGEIIQPVTGIYKHREWRGLRDTLYDYTQWLKLYGILAKWLLKHPILNIRGLMRYRWMANYLTVAAFYDRIMSRLRGPALRAARMNMNLLAQVVTELLEKTFTADEHLLPGNKKAKKIIYIDELVPKIIMSGMPGYETILTQMLPAYLPSLIVQQSPLHYINASEGYGLPADVCPLPSLEAGVAIDDDFPKIGCCMVNCNMPCDGSIMTTMLQDRRIDLPSYALNIPLRYTREDVQEYAVEEYKALIAFLEEQTGEKYNWDKLREACEIWNGQTRCKMEKWEMNRTETPPHTGSTVWLYRIFEYQAVCGDRRALENDIKVNKMLMKSIGKKRSYPRGIRYRAIVWNTPANMYANFNNWLADCWGIEVVCDMIDYQGSNIIDTSTNETMLAGIAKMAQGATMRVHTKGGYRIIMDDLWVKYEEYKADMVVMFDQISCKGVAAIKGLFEEEARRRNVHMMWVNQDLMDPSTYSRRDMRSQVNTYMDTVMREKPLDESLLDFDDSQCW